VNDLERYIPELGNLVEPFRFIPDWRIDDVMVSYAADQGSVGPHVDQYDVFLIQGEGKRRWGVNTDPNYPKELIPEISLAILKEFEPNKEWLLEKGDMLYLPPNMPHYGIAEGECFTFSIGFRAPRTLDLIQGWMESFADENTPHSQELTQRYQDIERQAQGSSGEISQKDLSNLSKLMIEGIENQQDNINIFLGKHLTQSNGEPESSHDSLSNHFDEKYNYERESWLRFAYITENDQLHFFAGGHHLELTLDKKTEIQELCENFYYTNELLKMVLDGEDKNSKLRQLFETLVNEGGLFATSA
jgi:50S ribosomal protein L16 3-hydroxylase